MNVKKNIKRSFIAISNVGRSLLVNLSTLLISYILINHSKENTFNLYVYFISIHGVFFLFTNWGGKFFNTKIISKEPNKLKKNVSNLISSKIILIIISIGIITFIQLDFYFKVLLIVYLTLKSLNPIFDSIIIYTKKSINFFISDLIINVIFILILFFNKNELDIKLFLFWFIFIELIKTSYYFYKLKRYISLLFSFVQTKKILKKSLPFFGLSVAGFLASKADFYIVGILINKEMMSNYFIISSLLSISMIIYANLINTFEISIYRFNTIIFNKLENSLKYFGFIFSIIASVFFYVISTFFYGLEVDYKITLLFIINLMLFILIHFEMYKFTKHNAQHIILYTLVLTGLLNIVCSFLLIKKFLLLGALFSNTISIFLNYLLLKIYYHKKIINEI